MKNEIVQLLVFASAGSLIAMEKKEPRLDLLDVAVEIVYQLKRVDGLQQQLEKEKYSVAELFGALSKLDQLYQKRAYDSFYSDAQKLLRQQLKLSIER